MKRGNLGPRQRPQLDRRLVSLALCVAVGAAAMLAASGASAGPARPSTKGLWTQVKGTPKPQRLGAKP
jgi:hypothetical protein